MAKIIAVLELENCPNMYPELKDIQLCYVMRSSRYYQVSINVVLSFRCYNNNNSFVMTCPANDFTHVQDEDYYHGLVIFKLF